MHTEDAPAPSAPIRSAAALLIIVSSCIVSLITDVLACGAIDFGELMHCSALSTVLLLLAREQHAVSFAAHRPARTTLGAEAGSAGDAREEAGSAGDGREETGGEETGGAGAGASGAGLSAAGACTSAFGSAPTPPAASWARSRISASAIRKVGLVYFGQRV